jgi:hypothetical protein
MTEQSLAPAKEADDERLRLSKLGSQQSEHVGASAPVNTPSKSIRPNVKPDEATLAREAEVKAHMDAFRAKRDPATKSLGPMFVNDRAADRQKKMDENRDAEKNIYTDDADAMIRRKDQQALTATGSTSADRMAQSASSVGKAVDRTLNEGGTAAKVVDKLTGGLGQTIQQIGLATEAQGMISAKKDSARQDAARTSKMKASETHSGLMDSLDSMRESKASGGGYEPGQGGALLRGMGETVIAHNNARRDAIAAGQDTIKPMSVDHTLGQVVPISVEDGTIIDSSLGDKAREHKDALKEGWTAEEKDLKQKPGQRKDGWFTKADPAMKKDWDERMSLNAEEGKKLIEEVAVVDTSAKEREKFKTRNLKGYKYGLHEDEAAEYRTARDVHTEASTNIEKAHDDHVASLQSSFDELTKTGEAQKTADRHRSNKAFGRKDSFSKKANLEDAERGIKEKQAEQSKMINKKIAYTQSAANSARDSGDTLSQQTKLDEIKRHQAELKQVQDGSHASLDSAVKHRNTLLREKTTGLTKEQQGQHDAMRAQLDKAKGDSTSGAGQTDIDARDDQKDTIDHYRFVKTHGMSAEEHDQKLEKEQRLLDIKKESDTGLTTDESKRHGDIQKERSDNKGLVARTRKFAKDHDGEEVKDGRAGGISAGLSPDKLITKPEDARSLALNEASRTTVRGGEVVEGNVDKARAANESGDHEHGRNIAISGATQGITDAVLSATGAGIAVSSTMSGIGKGLQAGGNIVGAATHEGADKAILAQEGRSLEHGSDGKTGRYHQVQNSVIDFHGPDAGAFKGDFAGGAKHILSAVQSQFGDDIKDGLAGAVTGSSVVNSIADHTATALKPVANIANQGAKIAHSAVDTVAPVAETVSEQANNVVDTVQGGAETVLSKTQETLGGGLGEVTDPGVGAGLANLVQHGSDAASEKISDTADTARDAIAENTTGLVEGAHTAITDNLEGLDGKAHDAVLEQADTSSRDAVDAAFDKANDLLTGPVEKDPVVIGGPRKVSPATEDPTPVVEPEPPVPTPVPTPVVEPDPVHKPKLDLAQIRAAGRKSTAAQAVKQHDPTSQVSDQTKQEYTSPELNQYSWKSMKTSGQRIRRGFQNAWQRTKNFGKRIGSRISSFFGR